MPVQANLISTAIKAQFAASGFTGKNDKDIADSVGGAVAKYLVIPNLVSCTLNGVMGPIGQISSIMIVGIVPQVMGSLMITKAASLKFTGTKMTTFFNAIASGVSQVLLGMLLSGNAVGIAVGAGTGKFTAISDQPLSKIILAEMLSRRLTGKNNKDIANIVAFGIANHLKSSATFTVMTTGAIAPVSPAGPVSVVSIPSIYTKIS
jgi:hypothetical protein